MRYTLKWLLFSLAFVPLVVNFDTLFPFIFTKTLLIRTAIALFWVLFTVFFSASYEKFFGLKFFLSSGRIKPCNRLFINAVVKLNIKEKKTSTATKLTSINSSLPTKFKARVNCPRFFITAKKYTFS